MDHVVHPASQDPGTSQRSLRASRSDSSSVSTSPSRTGPFTLRMMERLVSSMNSTRTYGADRGGTERSVG